jgi:hypothetical protein
MRVPTHKRRGQWLDMCRQRWPTLRQRGDLRLKP